MLTLLNTDGFVIDEIDVDFGKIHNNGIFDQRTVVNKLVGIRVFTDKIHFKKGRVNESNFSSVFGEYKNGKWFGRGDVFGIYRRDSNIFSFALEDFYIKSYYIGDDVIEIECVSKITLGEGGGNVLQSLRNNKLNELGIE
jgi:hypothetical protein